MKGVLFELRSYRETSFQDLVCLVCTRRFVYTFLGTCLSRINKEVCLQVSRDLSASYTRRFIYYSRGRSQPRARSTTISRDTREREPANGCDAGERASPTVHIPQQPYRHRPHHVTPRSRP
ncbi:hypothetical protein Pcinc_043617 [Petrolisthes cinctipes]|uniref:Uncharacterized protein n=1 Tax=Petrolisthes cinctipes TaxID=88211 RepID=A0AAE1BFB4_PETCI|nr:hypothetical protein Pcinc_043617 [Petrolisthes cinctipes]